MLMAAFQRRGAEKAEHVLLQYVLAEERIAPEMPGREVPSAGESDDEDCAEDRPEARDERELPIREQRCAEDEAGE